MLNIRTDLAMERHAISAEKGVDDGIIITEEELLGMTVTKAEVTDEKRAECKKGTYYTVETGKLWVADSIMRKNAMNAAAEILKRLCPSIDSKTVLVVGLGNREVTADAIGPKAVDSLVVTHHMKSLDPSLFHALALGDMAALCPAVLGQTGMESALIIKSVAEKLMPDLVIAIDALAAKSTERLGRTLQLSNSGIAPGSGINNRREELSAATIGCPVIAIGVPTVVDAFTLSACLTDKTPDGIENFFVTPKEADVMIRVNAKLIAGAINAAVHEKSGGGEEYAPL